MIGFKTDLQKQYIVLFRDKIFKNIDKLCSSSAALLILEQELLWCLTCTPTTTGGLKVLIKEEPFSPHISLHCSMLITSCSAPISSDVL